MNTKGLRKGSFEMDDCQPVKQIAQRITSLIQNKWAMSVLLSLGLAMDYQARAAVNSVFPLLRRDLLMTDFQIGLTATAFLWTYGLFSPVAGFLGDRFPRRTVLIGSMAGWSVVTILSGLVTSPWQLIAIRVILAVAQVAYVPTAQAMVADYHGKETLGKATGIFQAGCFVGIFFAGLPTAYLATHLSWRMMFPISGGIGLLLAGLMLALPGKQTKDATSSIDAVSQPSPTSVRTALSLFRIPSILAIMSAFALASGANWLFYTYLPLFIYEHHHLSLTSAAFLATSYAQMTGIVADPLLGHVSDKWAAKNVRNRFLFCAAAGTLGLPALAAVGFGNHLTILIAGLILFGMVAAGTDVSWMPMLSCVTSKYQRATAYGYSNMAACLAGGLTAMLAALTMAKFGLGLLIASGGILFVLLAVVLVVASGRFLERDLVPESLDESSFQDSTVASPSATPMT